MSPRPTWATITFTKFLVAETPAAFARGVDFPLLGLSADKPTYVSVRIFKWDQQVDNMYVLEPTDDFTVYPALVQMGSSSRRTVIIRSAHPLPDDVEGHYRIVLSEFDRADGTDRPAPDSGQVGFSLSVKPQVSLPLIVRGPSTLASAPLSVVGVRQVAAQPNDPTEPAHQLLLVRNTGEIYERLVAVGINAPAGAGNLVNGYVLPGKEVGIPMRIKSGDRVEVSYLVGPDARLNLGPDAKPDDRRIATYTVP